MSAVGVHKKKASLLALEKYQGKGLLVHCSEGRMLRGTLKGFDSNLNLVMANTVELLRDLTNPDERALNHAGVPLERRLGAVVIRGVAVSSVEALDGRLSIDNPFA
jgi:small nuclear ribonucleoprotein (snRNP)-like protein